MKRNKLWYPSVDDAKQANKVAVTTFKATKSEQFKVLSERKINEAIDRCKKRRGSVETKSACILKNFSDKNLHSFASGNRRTAYILMNQFLWKNKGYAIAKKKEYTSELFKELRRRDIPEKEILRWYRHTKSELSS